MPDINSFPQADGDSRPNTKKCDTCPAPATMFISDSSFGAYRCDSCGAKTVEARKGSPLLAWCRISRKVAA